MKLKHPLKIACGREGRLTSNALHIECGAILYTAREDQTLRMCLHIDLCFRESGGGELIIQRTFANEATLFVIAILSNTAESPTKGRHNVCKWNSTFTAASDYTLPSPCVHTNEHYVEANSACCSSLIILYYDFLAKNTR